MKIGVRANGRATLVVEAAPVHLAAPLAERCRTLKGLWVDPAHRKCGHATRLLGEVLAEADHDGTTLVIHPAVNLDDAPLDLYALVRWFTSRGFVTIDVGPPLRMARRPPYRDLHSTFGIPPP